MSEQHEKVVRKFYEAFQRGDYTTMQALYHPDATFWDPVFQELNATQVKAMWEMLLTSANDLSITFNNLVADDNKGRCRWEAWYTFSKTQRRVHNIIEAYFIFQDGLILRHTDTFDLWRWTRFALGFSGVLLGWSPLIQSKIRLAARERLKKFMASKAPL